MGQWLSSRPVVLVAIAGFSLAVALASSCEGGGGGGTPGVGGGGGEGGASGCPDGVAPLFTLRVSAAEGLLPEDLVLQVSWSVGDEPAVLLADEASYGNAEDNVVCARTLGAGGATSATAGATSSGIGGAGGLADPATSSGSGGAGPVDELICELWTSGATRVRLDAMGYVPFDDTLQPATLDGCDRPVASEVPIEVVAEEPVEEEND